MGKIHIIAAPALPGGFRNRLQEGLFPAYSRRFLNFSQCTAGRGNRH